MRHLPVATCVSIALCLIAIVIDCTTAIPTTHQTSDAVPSSPSLQYVPDELWETILLHVPVTDPCLEFASTQLIRQSRPDLYERWLTASRYIRLYQMRALLEAMNDEQSAAVVQLIARYQLFHYSLNNGSLRRLIRIIIDARKDEALRLLLTLGQGVDVNNYNYKDDDGDGRQRAISSKNNIVRQAILGAVESMAALSEKERMMAINWLADHNLINAAERLRMSYIADRTVDSQYMPFDQQQIDLVEMMQSHRWAKHRLTNLN